MALLFEATEVPRAKRLWRMHVSDAGDDGIKTVIEFKCKRCGHNTGWIADKWTVTENRRGHPCPKCNQEKANG